MSEIYVLAGAGESELVEKRSRFLGHLRPATSEEEARAFIEKVKKEHYDARHNCWCYRIGPSVERYSDDGEPQGTAGVPMLEVLRREGVTDAVCVVTRYFGGVLLGAGGLLRAYTQSAKDALDAAGLCVVRPWEALLLSCPYALLERMKLETAAFDGVVEDCAYGAEVELRVLLPAERSAAYQARVFDCSAGAVRALPQGKCSRPAPFRAPKGR
ncbi:MAG: YigZ family protein [Oscillospiraceae bacterium]|nr:YigZ family protein [Oscillospiraceae bacterium]